MATSAERQRRLRERRAKEGRVAVQIWVSAAVYAKILEEKGAYASIVEVVERLFSDSYT